MDLLLALNHLLNFTAPALAVAVLLDRGYHLCIPTGRAPNPALDDLRGWLLTQACGQGGS